MPILTVGRTDIPYTIKQSASAKRRRIVVTASAVEIIVPKTANNENISGFIQRKRRWIYDKRQEILERLAASGKSTFSKLQSGSVITYKGRRAKLRISRTSRKNIGIEYRNGFYVSIPKQMTDQQIDACIDLELKFWLRDRLKLDAVKLAKAYAQNLGFKFKMVSIVNSSSLWGSCTKNGLIKINLHLVEAPQSVLAYVVLHEICHLKHRNHSKEFWALLASVMPDYEARKKWLEKMNPVFSL